MRTKILVVFLISAFIIQGLAAQDSPEKLIEEFFENYEKKGSDAAIDEIYKSNPWTSRIQDGIDNIKVQFSRFDTELVGEYYGYELLTTKNLGDSYSLHAYFIKFDRQFLRLTFQFYKPGDEWRLYSFKFDDNYDDEIEEAAKLYYLNLNAD